MNPIILADNRFLDGIPSATDFSDDTPLLVRDLRPYTFVQWPTAGTKYLTVDCGSAKSADSLGIIGHNLYSATATVSVESSPDNSTWTPRLSGFTPASDRALLKTFTTASARYWRLKIVTAAVAPMVAVVLIGARLEFPFSPDGGFIPYTESVEADSNDSKTGQPLGAVIRYWPVEIKPSFSYPSRTFVDSTWLPFRESYGRYRKYFFWAWDLTTYPDQVFFVQDTSDFSAPVHTLAYYDKLSLKFKGVAER